jgi:hypothetical protein
MAMVSARSMRREYLDVEGVESTFDFGFWIFDWRFQERLRVETGARRQVHGAMGTIESRGTDGTADVADDRRWV